MTVKMLVKSIFLMYCILEQDVDSHGLHQGDGRRFGEEEGNGNTGQPQGLPLRTGLPGVRICACSPTTPKSPEGESPSPQPSPIEGEGVRPLRGRGLRDRHSGESRNPEGSTPLTLSLSKGLRGLKGWFDKLTMSGFAKVSLVGEGQDEGESPSPQPSPIEGEG